MILQVMRYTINRRANHDGVSHEEGPKFKYQMKSCHEEKVKTPKSEKIWREINAPLDNTLIVSICIDVSKHVVLLHEFQNHAC